MSAKRTQVFLLAGALALFVLLLMAPKDAPSAERGKEPASVTTSDKRSLEVYVNMALKNVEPGQKAALEKMAALKQNDSLLKFWDKVKRPDIASYYAEERARMNDKAEDWFKAGERYYYSVQFCNDKTEVPVLYQCAIRCFDKALQKEPQNTNARILQASCYVEGTPEPMTGISRLKEIEKTDSNNVKLQLAFAFFSVKSGQTEKAIRRFNKVLEIDPQYIAAYLHLADAYEQQGDTGKTIEMLERYASKTSDVTARLEINRYILKLKSNKN